MLFRPPQPTPPVLTRRCCAGAPLAAIALLLALGTAACRRDPPSGGSAPATSAGAEALPPLVLKDDTQKLLLTWVDEKGDFHVVQKVADVPEAARTAVRVVLTDKEAGTGAVVYVADLRSKNSDGSYLVKTMARGQWDEVGAARRKQRLEALLAPPAASAGSEAPRPGATGGEANPKARSATVIAVVYGADWCKPCHDAERYLRQKGVTVIKKDIEQSDGARAELQSKLQRAGLPASASIPIIDVMGRMIVGFSPGALDRALDAVRASQTL